MYDGTATRYRVRGRAQRNVRGSSDTIHHTRLLKGCGYGLRSNPLRAPIRPIPVFPDLQGSTRLLPSQEALHAGTAGLARVLASGQLRVVEGAEDRHAAQPPATDTMK